MFLSLKVRVPSSCLRELSDRGHGSWSVSASLAVLSFRRTSSPGSRNAERRDHALMAGRTLEPGSTHPLAGPAMRSVRSGRRTSWAVTRRSRRRDQDQCQIAPATITARFGSRRDVSAPRRSSVPETGCLVHARTGMVSFPSGSDSGTASGRERGGRRHDHRRRVSSDPASRSSRWCPRASGVTSPRSAAPLFRAFVAVRMIESHRRLDHGDDAGVASGRTDMGGSNRRPGSRWRARRVVTLERLLAAQSLVEEHSDRVQVARGLCCCLRCVRREVGRTSEELPCPGERLVRVNPSRDAEVGHLPMCRRRRRGRSPAHVPMDDPHSCAAASARRT